MYINKNKQFENLLPRLKALSSEESERGTSNVHSRNGNLWEKIASWVAGRENVSVGEVIEQCLQQGPTQQSRKRVARHLRANGWVRYQQRRGHSREWRYRFVNPPVTSSATPEKDGW